MRWAESAVQGYHDAGQPAHDGGSHFSGGTVEGTAAPTPAWSVPSYWRAWLARLRASGEGLDPVAVVVNQPSVEVKLGDQVPSDCLSDFGSRQLRYTVLVPPDSSSTLSADSSSTLSLLPILLAAPGFVGERGGEKGK